MNKLTRLLIIVLFLLPFLGHGQGGQRRQRVEHAKVNFLTSRLNLNTDQSSKFWPLYKEYDGKRTEIKRSMASLRSETLNLTATDEQIKEDIRMFFALKQKELDLDNEYFDKFQKAITIRQVAELYRSEKLFAVELLKKLEERKERGK